MLCRKKPVRFNSIKDVLHLFTYCISTRIMRLFQDLFCLSGNPFWRSKVLLLKQKPWRKMRLRLDPIKRYDLSHFSTSCVYIYIWYSLAQCNIHTYTLYLYVYGCVIDFYLLIVSKIIKKAHSEASRSLFSGAILHSQSHFWTTIWPE